ncbi:hypothetical protein [Leptospira paudalimensis]|uniref:Uncharacterized protein n=1 Tax=Leptospira paudalimensis TaxID=2950024 RepID=A0ABT3MAL0_9LEPT|nr:hypothetical protein [Leptospira paudalimensis]MCW7505051.1 hypothetical protein [Leptospira paudalimensis]
MKYFLICSILCLTQCAFANLDHQIKPFPKELERNKIGESITILNQNRVFFQKGHKRFVEINPMFGMHWSEYFPKKQKEIGQSRYHWKEIYIHNIDDGNFQLTDVRTDYVFFVTASHPRSDWEEGRFSQVLQLITHCIIPCKQKFIQEVKVKLFYKNSLLSEKVSSVSGTSYLSPWYIPFPFLFQMRDYGNLTNEPSLVSALYLQGFQEAIDEIYLNLPDELAKETKGVP